MKKYILSVAVASSLVVSNLMAIDYNEALNLIKNKSFKIIHAPYGFDNKIAMFDENGIATDGNNTITLQSDGTLKDNQQGEKYIDGETIPINGFSWTIIDNDNNGFILSRTDGGESPASGVLLDTSEQLISVNINSDLDIIQEIGNYYVLKFTDSTEDNPYDAYASLEPNGYVNWYNYLSTTNGKINQYDSEGLYDTDKMMVLRGDLDCGGDSSFCDKLNAPMIIDQNNTRLFVQELTPMGELRESTFLLQDNHIILQMKTIMYLAKPKSNYPNIIIDSNTTQKNNVTTPPEQSNLDIFYPNGWSLSGVGKDENLSVSNIKCQNGNLTSMWKYKNNQWNLYVPSNIDYGYTTFDTLNNRDGFWVNCQ